MGRLNRPLLIVLCVYGFGLNTIHVLDPSSDAVKYGPTFLMLGHGPSFFVVYTVGALLWVYREVFTPNWQGAVVAGGVLAATLRFGGFNIAAPLFLPIALIYLAHSFRWTTKVDLSYGTYLYHFPILQLLAVSSTLRGYPVLFLTAGLCLTLAAAFASWHVVEAPCIRRSQAHAVNSHCASATM